MDLHAAADVRRIAVKIILGITCAFLDALKVDQYYQGGTKEAIVQTMSAA